MRQYIILTLCAVMILVTAGCGNRSENAPSAVSPSASASTDMTGHKNNAEQEVFTSPDGLCQMNIPSGFKLAEQQNDNAMFIDETGNIVSYSVVSQDAPCPKTQEEFNEYIKNSSTLQADKVSGFENLSVDGMYDAYKYEFDMENGKGVSYFYKVNNQKQYQISGLITGGDESVLESVQEAAASFKVLPQ